MELSEAQRSERDLLLRALREEDWILARAAEALGVATSTVLRRVKRYGLDADAEAHNSRLRVRRQNHELPRAPHEKSRQAMEQQQNRERGLCGCGRPPAKRLDGRLGKSCAIHLSRDRDRKKPKR